MVSDLNIILLGGEGFIGRNIAAYFSQRARCLSLSKEPSFFRRKGDIFLRTDPYQQKVEHMSNVIIHLVDNKVSQKEFLSQEEQLVKNIDLNSRHHLILFSSAVVYANPDSEYGQRKLMLENFYQSFCEENKVRLTILRPFNLYGPYQAPFRPGSLVANLFYNHLEARPTEINDLNASRDFLFIGDLARFVGYVVEQGLEGTHDLGSGRSITIRELIHVLEEKIFKENMQIVDTHSKDMSKHCVADGDLLDILPVLSLEDGLGQTLDFFRENISSIRDYIKRENETISL